MMTQFEQFYIDQFGEDRWKRLLSALEKPTQYSCLINRMAVPQMVAERLDASLKARDLTRVEQVPFITTPCLYVPDIIDSSLNSDMSENMSERKENEDAEGGDDSESEDEQPIDNRVFLPPVRDERNLYVYYCMDAASILSTEPLNIRSGDSVLDLCAAPGGKSLTIAQRLFGSQKSTFSGHLVSNEWNNGRRLRLLRVMKSYLPPALFERSKLYGDRPNVEITGYDGTCFASRARADGRLFNKILVDAPCSSDRHLVHQNLAKGGGELQKWTTNKSKQIAKTQFALVSEALQLLDRGGLMVYATCSLSHFENDDVIDKIVKKFKKGDDGLRVKVLSKKWPETRWPVGEKTKYGWLVTPDNSNGWGPLFFSLLTLTEN